MRKIKSNNQEKQIDYRKNLKPLNGNEKDAEI